jgi:dTDP-4-amino-4,6-dideoxygalactose transaminase
MSDDLIYVTQPYLPPLDEFMPYLESIWKSKVLTNSGPMHQQLEQALCEYFDVPEVALFNNGTNALLTALQVLDIKGEVITTPYSFVATAHSILWNNLNPVFVDIDPVSLNLDPLKIEAAITPKTSAIMPVHCYGNPCDVVAIQKIADKHGLKVIYDAAHAFGVMDEGGSILRHGDLSILSFHATKVFNTFEGGAIICKDAAIKKKIDNLKNFGIVDELTVSDAGLNGKMSEVNAAMGLLQLRHIDDILAQRCNIDTIYRSALNHVKGITVIPTTGQQISNYSYFPILIGADYPLTRDELFEKLKENNILARRYFYPLISSFSVYNNINSAQLGNLPVAIQAAQQVLCLPMHPNLTSHQIYTIIDIVRG